MVLFFLGSIELLLVGMWGRGRGWEFLEREGVTIVIEEEIEV